MTINSYFDDFLSAKDDDTLLCKRLLADPALEETVVATSLVRPMGRSELVITGFGGRCGLVPQ